MSIKAAPAGIAAEVEVTNWTTFVVYVENNLGWNPPVTDTKPLWKCRAIEAGKLKKQAALKPDLVTLDNLVLAVEYCIQRKEAVSTPTAVVWKIKPALEAAREPELHEEDLSTVVGRAISKEHELADAESPGWIARLSRAMGPYRAEVLADWKRERGHG